MPGSDNKRPSDDSLITNKRLKTEPDYDGLFDPLPFESENTDFAPDGHVPESSGALVTGLASSSYYTPDSARNAGSGSSRLPDPSRPAPSPQNSAYRPVPGVAGPNLRGNARYDLRKTYSTPATMARTGSSNHNTNSTNNTNSGNGSGSGNGPEDPLRLNDVLAAAGVDIQREEDLLASNYQRSAPTLNMQLQLMSRQRLLLGALNAFLHPYHVALFMNKAARQNGVVQNFMLDPEMLELVSAACHDWLAGVVTKTVALARHRRRGIPAFSKLGAAQQNKSKAGPPRSEVSKELRNLALRQKELEERRVAKRQALGLEQKGDVAPETGNKAGADETLHRAANATAAMMSMNPLRKKYSWMSASSGGGDPGAGGGSKDAGQKQSALLAQRGDNGLRFREIRTGNMVTTKDLLSVLEDERVGATKALTKGYARLKD